MGWIVAKKWILLCLVSVVFFSCKSGKVVTDGTVNPKLSAKNIIKNHYKGALNFTTLSGRMKIDYSDGESSQGIGVSVRMEKDKAIWMSAPLGVVKAYITPDRVSYYNKLDNEYFDGDFTYLSELLGTELNFEKVQNLLLGQALLDLREENFFVSVTEDTYELKPIIPKDLFKIVFMIEPTNFKMATQQIAQPLEKRVLGIRYISYQNIDNYILPNNIAITAMDAEERTTIEIEYRNIELNRELSFPYKIPDGFKEIVVK